MARFFYAHMNPYGIGATYQNADGSTNRMPGTIYRFPSKAARDEWVSSDVWDGKYRRQAVAAHAVRHVISRHVDLFGDLAWSDPAESGAQTLNQ